MHKIGIFYGSSTGNTQHVAKLIGAAWEGEDVEVLNVRKAEPGTLSAFELIILGTSTWDDGQLQDHWARFIKKLDDVDLNGKKVAIFGLGDQAGFPDQFVNAMAALDEKARALGAEVIGEWPTEGYTFKKSKAVSNGNFVGLVLDQDRQRKLTEPRVQQWVGQLKETLGWG